MTPAPIRVLRDVPYGEGATGYGGGAGPGGRRTLCFDAYLPAGDGAARPALVLAFGGAFHRGSKADDSFAGESGSNTAVAEYCRRFAARGFACFSVDYRLAPDDPPPGDDPVLGRPGDVPVGRAAAVRVLMGLPPATSADLARTMEAAFADVAAAARAVAARAAEFGVDARRIVLGGWSAGARCALYAAFAKGVPCAGVLALSGVLQPEDLARVLAAEGPRPPSLFVVGERDLPYLVTGVGPQVAALRAAGAAATLRRVPGADHWYPAEAATDAGASVEEGMLAAVTAWTGR